MAFAQRDLVIYEMHVRGFTRHESSKTESPGTYLDVVKKLDHLKVHAEYTLSFMVPFCPYLYPNSMSDALGLIFPKTQDIAQLRYVK